MDIDSTPLDFEIKRVLENPVQAPYFNYTGEFKVGDRYLQVMRIKDVDEVHNYQEDVAPDIQVMALVGLGDLMGFIYPNRDNLEFILVREELNSNTNAPSYNEESIVSTTYDAKISSDIRPIGAENNDWDLPPETQNLVELREIRVALKPKIMEQISKIQTGGPFRDTTTSNLLRGLIKHYSDLAEVPDDEKLLSIDIDDRLANQVPKKIINIPHGTPLIDLADYLQNMAGGIYPTGCGQFVHERRWSVFPLFDTTRFDEATDKAVIVLVPQKRYPIVEKTYLHENNVTTILVTGQKIFKSDKEAVQQVTGNGVMYTDAKSVMGGLAEKRGGITVLNRGKANSEFVGEQRKDGRNIVRKAPEEITDNPFPILSRLARNQGHTMQVTWRNADPRILKPGMSIRVYYQNEGEVAFFDSVLIGSHTQVKLRGNGAIANGYEVVIGMFLYFRSTEGSNDFLGMN